jgi:predicted lipoprotein
MTKAEAKMILGAEFPGVDFRVFIGSYARGTNYTRPVIEVSYNYKKNPIDYRQVAALIPGSSVHAVGKK